MLQFFATCFTSKETPAGCFMINTSATLAASSKEIANTVKSRHAMQEETLSTFEEAASVAEVLIIKQPAGVSLLVKQVAMAVK